MRTITKADIKDYQARANKAKNIGEFKEIGRELKNTFSLTDMEAIDILNDRNELAILAKYKKGELNEQVQ